jgi:TPR repeat protein
MSHQGCEASMNNLGYLYKRGGSGILRDMNEAIFWFTKGAEAGDMYERGRESIVFASLFLLLLSFFLFFFFFF